MTGSPDVPCYLVDAERPALFDAGFSCLGPAYEKHLKQLLGDRQPAYLFLTHVHFYHCGAAAYLKSVFSDMKIAASPQAAAILSRPNAVKLIGELNQTAAQAMAEWDNPPDNPIEFKTFNIDIEVEDSDRLDLGIKGEYFLDLLVQIVFGAAMVLVEFEHVPILLRGEPTVSITI